MVGTRAHADWIEAYLEHTDVSEAPRLYHFWCAVSTIAGALRRRVWIEEYKYQIVPNFYIALVAPPGVVKKSTALRVGLSLLEKVPGVKLGPQSVTWQALTKALEEAQINMSLAEKKIPMSCLTIGIGELGTFLKPDDDGLLSALIAMWDGQLETWKHTTISRGETTIKNPWLNIIGGTTPAWLKTNFPELMLEGGLVSRVIFVFASEKRRHIAFPSRHINGNLYNYRRASLIQDLIEIAQLKGPMKLSEDAYSWGEAWYSSLDANRPPALSAERYAGFFSRKFTHAMKLAIILNVSRTDTLVIEPEDMILAAEKLEELEAPMLDVFQNIGGGAASKHIREISTFVKAYQTVTVDGLYRACYMTMSRREFDEALLAANRAGILRVGKQNGKTVATWTGAAVL